MKRFFAISFLLAALMWAGAVLTIPKEDLQGRTVLYWSTDPNPARARQLAPFEEMHPDLVVKVEPNTFDKTIVQASSGVGPDLIEIYSATDMAAYAEAGVLLDLTPYAEQFGIKPEITWEKLRGNLTYRGKLYRFPANAASNVLMFNKKKFREAGLPYPTDAMRWEEFINLVKPLTLRRPNGSYEQFALGIGRGYIPDLPLQFGGRFFNADLTQSTLDSPEFIAGLELYKDLIRTHRIVPSPEAADALTGGGGWGTGEIQWFAAGRAATLWGSRWMLVIFRDYPELHEELGVVLLPRPEQGTAASYSGTRGPGINVKSENRDAALKFLGYLASPEYGEVIAQSSDALPPNAEFGSDPANLLNPNYPNETYQDVFIRSMEFAEPVQVSPFIDAKVTHRIWEEALDLISNGLESPEAALREAARRVNEGIERNLYRREDLRQLYHETTGEHWKLPE